MAFFSWMAQEQELTSASLTVLAQAVNPNDDGRLLWDVFMPRRPVDSIEIDTITPNIAKRYVADRREWNARGRYIPQETPATAQLEMVPIEAYYKLDEREIQKLLERVRGNQDIFRQLVVTDIPARTRGLVQANYNRIEKDTMDAWSTGQITARNPVTGLASVFSYGFAAGRYQTAAPAWTGGAAGTAYTKFVDWLLSALDLGMNIQGAMMRLSTREAIRTSAPNIAFPDTTFEPILADVEKRIQDEIGSAFSFYLNERTVDVFSDGGIIPTQAKLWPVTTVAVVPQGETVGYNAFAPVARAYDVSAAEPEAEIDMQSQVVFIETANGGRELTVEAQVNALPVPIETQMFVINAGI